MFTCEKCGREGPNGGMFKWVFDRETAKGFCPEHGADAPPGAKPFGEFTGDDLARMA